MNYEVYWNNVASAHINRLWLRSADPERVMDVYDDVNRLLAESPGEQGESRSSSTVRLWHHSPFALLFHINEEQREVVIVDVKWIGD